MMDKNKSKKSATIKPPVGKIAAGQKKPLKKVELEKGKEKGKR